MDKTSNPIRIAYLPLYVNYYEGIWPELPIEKREVARVCAETLARHGELIWDGELVSTAEQAEAAGEKLASANPDCVVVLPTLAVFGSIPWASLRQLSQPVLIWNAQRLARVDKDFTMTDMVRNTSQIGAQALANTLLRNGRSFRVLNSHRKSKHTKANLKEFFTSVRVVKAIKSARLLLIGEAFPGMSDVELDHEYLKQHLGAEVVRAGAEEVTREYQAVADKDVQKLGR